MKKRLLTLFIALFALPCLAGGDDGYFLEYDKKASFHYNPFGLPLVSLLLTDYKFAYDPKKVEQTYFLFNIETPGDQDGSTAYGFTMTSGEVANSPFSIEPSLYYKKRLFFAALTNFALYSKAELGISQLILPYEAQSPAGLNVAPSYGVKGKLGVGAEFFFNEWIGLLGGVDRSLRYQFPRAKYPGTVRYIHSHHLYLGVATSF